MLREALSAAALGCGRVLIGRRFSDSLRVMQEAQWLAREELARRSGARLARLLRHTAAHVPFYREAAGRLRLDPARIGVEDLHLFPVLDKTGYRSRPPEAFYAGNVGEERRIGRATSGSTGRPFRFALDAAAMPVIFASHLFYDSWFGLKLFDRYLRIAAPAAAPPADGQAPFTARIRAALVRRAQRWYEGATQERIAIWEVDAGRAEQIWRRIERFRPAFVMGYTSTLSTLADELSRLGLELSRRVRGVIAIAETLSPERRNTIERYFRAPVINRYGLREFGSWCAQSCAVTPERLHLNTELVVCEILREDGTPAGEGETGRVVLTDLHNYARPFIRYDTGDLAAMGGPACPCGRGFPLLGPIAGRSQECLRTPSGKVISPAILGHYLFVYHSHLEGVLQYQLVQERRGRACLLIVPSPALDGPGAERLREDLGRLLGPEMEIEVKMVQAIAPEPSGKRPIIKVVSLG